MFVCAGHDVVWAVVRTLQGTRVRVLSKENSLNLLKVARDVSRQVWRWTRGDWTHGSHGVTEGGEEREGIVVVTW